MRDESSSSKSFSWWRKFPAALSLSLILLALLAVGLLAINSVHAQLPVESPPPQELAASLTRTASRGGSIIDALHESFPILFVYDPNRRGYWGFNDSSKEIVAAKGTYRTLETGELTNWVWFFAGNLYDERNTLSPGNYFAFSSRRQRLGRSDFRLDGVLFADGTTWGGSSGTLRAMLKRRAGAHVRALKRLQEIVACPDIGIRTACQAQEQGLVELLKADRSDIADSETYTRIFGQEAGEALRITLRQRLMDGSSLRSDFREALGACIADIQRFRATGKME